MEKEFLTMNFVFLDFVEVLGKNIVFFLGGQDLRQFDSFLDRKIVPLDRLIIYN